MSLTDLIGKAKYKVKQWVNVKNRKKCSKGRYWHC